MYMYMYMYVYIYYWFIIIEYIIYTDSKRAVHQLYGGLQTLVPQLIHSQFPKETKGFPHLC